MIIQDTIDAFAPAPELDVFARSTFIDDACPLHNPEHYHLRQARIGWLWTNVPNRRGGRAVLGTAEIPSAKGGKWAIARQEWQLRQWFGALPDFVITLSAAYCLEVADDAQFCALVEHELLHCGQARDQFGAPKFSKDTGRPIFAIRGHDVEEFTSIVRRYGADAAGVREFVDAARATPMLAASAIASACGTCQARAA